MFGHLGGHNMSHPLLLDLRHARGQEAIVVLKIPG